MPEIHPNARYQSLHVPPEKFDAFLTEFTRRTHGDDASEDGMYVDWEIAELLPEVHVSPISQQQVQLYRVVLRKRTGR